MIKINLSTLKPLHIIGKYLGIWPSFDTSTMEVCNCYFWYGVLMLIILISQQIYMILGRVTILDQIDNSVFITMLLADVTTTATNISAIVNINFLQAKRLQTFLQEIHSLESTFCNIRKDECGERRRFYIELITGHIVIAAYMIYNTWQWTGVIGWQMSQYSLMHDLQFYHILIMVLLIRNYVLLIKYKIETLNFMLENCGPNKYNQEWNLDSLSKLYTKVSNVIDGFNEIFGWNLMVLQVQLIANLLGPLNLALVYGGATFMGKQMDFNLYILCFIWFITPLMNMLTVISACDKTKREAAKVPKICYNLISDSTDEEYIKKVKSLALQGELQKPEFSAAGFLTFDYSLVFPTMTSILSYFIVLIQFRS
ncbi:gustatory receptor 68a-like [Atheta coriaria]|uniref:gustatory receptor 68a-like n=1 Tax=Dalotia coriaria TaxID=877792 RepID=UPI0031F419FA